MNHGQESAFGTLHRRRRFAWLFAIALVALISSLLGATLLLTDAWQKTYASEETTVQANVANPADTSVRPTR